MADEVRRYELTSKTDLKNGLYSESLFSGLSLPNVGPNTRVYVRILAVSCFFCEPGYLFSHNYCYPFIVENIFNLPV